MAAPTTTSVTSPALSATSCSSYDLLSNSIMSAFEMPSGDYDSDQIVWSFSESDVSDLSDGFSDEGGAASDDDFVLLNTSIPASGRTTALGGAVPRSRALPIQESQPPTPDPPSDIRSLETQMATLTLSVKSARAARKAEKKQKKKEEKLKNPELVAQKKAKVKAKRRAKKAKARKIAEAAALKTGLSHDPAPTPLKKRSSKSNASSSTAVVKPTGLGLRPIVDDLSDHVSVGSSEQESTTGPSLYDEASIFISR